MAIKPIKAYAIVDKKKPKLSAFQIYTEGDVMLNDNEMLIEVSISCIDSGIIKGKGKIVTLTKNK